MSIFVKICGLRTRDAVDAAVEAGADALGFVFAPSPREIEPEQAMRLTEGVPRQILRIAVMRHPGQDAWDRVRRVFSPDYLQTEADDFRFLELGQEVSRLPVYRDGGALPPPHEKLLLFEGAHSGCGERADWGFAATLAARQEVILAGGLTPANVQDAVGTVCPYGVDVSSGIESAPGIKDPQRIADFIRAARRAGVCDV